MKEETFLVMLVIKDHTLWDTVNVFSNDPIKPI